jgi:hypothetical protein
VPGVQFRVRVQHGVGQDHEASFSPHSPPVHHVERDDLPYRRRHRRERHVRHEHHDVPNGVEAGHLLDVAAQQHDALVEIDRCVYATVVIHGC